MSSTQCLERYDPSQLAWTLVDLMQPHLPRRQRISLVTMIGAGEVDAAIVDLIDYCTEIDIELPESLLDPLHLWARGYRGTPLERMLRVRIDALFSDERPING